MKKRLFHIIILFVTLAYLPAYANISLNFESSTGSTTDIDFGELRAMNDKGDPLSNSNVQTATISVVNTSGKQYKVTQRLGSPIVNDNNFQASLSGFSFISFGNRTSGRLLMQSTTQVSSAEQVLFISDKAGTDDSFQIQYTFNTPPGAQAGRYRSNFIYTVSLVE